MYYAVKNIIVICTFLIILSGIGSATTITVDDDGSQDYTCIQNAINAASNGDNILVYPGNYVEDVLVNKSINISSTDGPYVTKVIGGYKADYVFSLVVDEVTISGFDVSSGDKGIYLKLINNSTLTNNIVSTNDKYGIYLNSSYKNILINNTVSNNGEQGIFLNSSNNNTLINNTVSNNKIGIYLKSTIGNNLMSNMIADNSKGIYLRDSINNTLNDNDAKDNSVGFYLWYSYNNTLINATSSGNSRSISLYYSKNNTIENNYMSKNGEGIYLANSDGNILKSNEILDCYTNNGIEMEGADKNILNNNTISNSNDHGIYLCGSNNYLINNVAVDNRNGIFLEGSNNNSIFNATASKNRAYGIYLRNAENNRLTNNIVSHNGEQGIYLWAHSYNNIINHNNASYNYHKGILIDLSGNITVVNNTIVGNEYGIFINNDYNNHTLAYNKVINNENAGIWIRSDHNTLNKNIISKNGPYGIYLLSANHNTLSHNNVSDSSSSGIVMSSSNSNTITNNRMLNNGGHGIQISYSNNNTFESNRFLHNSWKGIALKDSNYNFIYNNLFNNSNNTYIHGENIGNIWNATKTSGKNIIGGPYIGGNCWLTPNDTGYSQTHNDLEGDGICDDSYIIATGHIDNLPLCIDNNTNPAIPIAITNYNPSNSTIQSSKNVTQEFNITINQICNVSWFINGTEIYYSQSVTYSNYFNSSIETGTYNVTVFASNSNGTVSKIWNWTVVNSAPVAKIISIYNSTEDKNIIVFNGSGTDFDGTIVSYNWTSNIDGQLSNLSKFNSSNLSRNNHTIYFSVQDNNGVWSDTVSTTLNLINETSDDLDDDIPSGNTDSSSNSGGGGGGGATGEEFENIASKHAQVNKVAAGEDVRYEFNEDSNAVMAIQFKSLTNEGQTKASIEVLKDTSALVNAPAPGKVYQNLNIWVGNVAFDEDDMEDPVVGFRVSKEWISDNDVDPSSVVLCRYHDSEWSHLPTGVVDENEHYFVYESETPGFSPFAISTIYEEEKSSTDTIPSSEETYDDFVEEEEVVENDSNTLGSNATPGFSILLSMGVLLLMAMIFRKKG